MATTLHNDLTKANLNAWHIWWLYNASGNGGCLYDTSTNVWTKRLWVLGNYSRFVRPGFMRVSTSGTAPSGVLVSAYQNPADGTVVVVAINSNTSATPLSLYVSGVVPCSITPWVTSAADNLAAKSAITVSNARFSATLDAQSVTSFVGKLKHFRATHFSRAGLAPIVAPGSQGSELDQNSSEVAGFAGLPGFRWTLPELRFVGGTGIELGRAKPKTIGAAPTCSGYAELQSLCSSAEFR